MPRIRFSPDGGAQRVSPIALSAVSRKVAPPAIGLSMAMNHCGVLRKMTGVFERLDHRLVRVALVALVGDDPPALEAGRLAGEGAVLVDRVGNARIDVALSEELLRLGRGPQLEVLAPVAGSGVDE